MLYHQGTKTIIMVQFIWVLCKYDNLPVAIIYSFLDQNFKLVKDEEKNDFNVKKILCKKTWVSQSVLCSLHLKV